jgi:mannitol/fructose-specific phosphotransferase system IIA component (Ntr-type)
LKEPIYWEKDFMADLVFMIALKEESKEYLFWLNKLVLDKATIQKLRESKTYREMKRIIISFTNYVM